jgi:hypothetical protein
MVRIGEKFILILLLIHNNYYNYIKESIMKKLILTLLLIVTFTTSQANLLDSVPKGKNTHNKISLLILQQANNATLSATKNHCYHLILANLAPGILYFANQPSQLVGQMNNAQFIKLWHDGAVHNAGLHTHYQHHGDDKTESIVLALSKPTYQAKTNTFTYQACVNDAAAQKVILPAQLTNITLFIDPLDTNIWG